MNKPRVFISHSSLDKEFARTLSDELQTIGIKSWLDEKEITVGDLIIESVQDGLEESDYIIVIFSPESAKSNWVKTEYLAMLDIEINERTKKILPVLIKNCSIPLFLRGKKYADFRNDFDHGFEELKKALESDTISFSKPFRSKDSKVTLDIQDKFGKVVKYTKESLLLCNQDGSDSYTEEFYVDGYIDDFRVLPGQPIKTWDESGTSFFKIRFPEKLLKGEIVKKKVNFNIHNSFSKSCEYWEQRTHIYGDKVQLIIKFPLDRKPSKWEVYIKDSTEQRPSEFKVDRYSEDDRIVLCLNIDKPELYIGYVLKWWW